MLLGTVLSNEQQASALSLLLGLGLGLAAFGGSMVPLEVFSSTIRTAAHVTPHAWANDAFNTLVKDGGGVRDILGDLTVLVGYATVLLGLATWRLRRALTAD
jgi:ABC-2 type transport system permease protein